jgi:hypothetical protein
MKLYQINTTGFAEEDMLLVSDAPEDAIEKALEPLVTAERNDEGWYDHDDYLSALETALPQFTFFYYTHPKYIQL